MTHRRFVFLSAVALILCFSNLQSAAAQVSKIEPENLIQGAKVVITYNPKAEGARISAADDIYVSTMTAATDGAIKSFVGKMEKAGDLFKYEMSLAPNLYSIQIDFVTLRGWDDKAAIKKKVTRPDGSPARNASLKLGKDYLEAFNKEISLYPDNYQAYREKWFAASYFDKERVKDIVAEDMKKLDDVKEESADLLYARSYGYLTLGQEPKSREAIKSLVAHFPTSPLLQHALGDYSYQVFAQQIKNGGQEEVDKLTGELVQKYPHSSLAREYIFDFASRPDFPLATVEAVLQKWMQDEPEHPMPPELLAGAYMARKQKLDLASSLVEKSLSLVLRGFDRLYISRSGGADARMVPRSYHLAAAIAFEQQKYPQALAAIKAAQAMMKETTDSFLLLEARIWEALNDTVKAESAYLEADRLSSKDAEKALLAMYTKKHGNAEGFADYLAKARSKSSSTAASRNLAKSFKATSLDGKPYDLAALRGKVVVVNFWFIGCAPCRVEMPGLNQLVAEFKDKEVVFLALALDPAEDLQKFLKTAKFTYTIVPDASEIATTYEVGAYPTHIVIDKKGQIVGRLTGGSDNRHEQIRPLIQRALTEQ